MNGYPSLEQLATGYHEKCHWCRRPFKVEDDKLVRYKAQDGNFYCRPECASAPYLTPRTELRQ